MLNILADGQIPLVEELFAPLGHVSRFNRRQLAPKQVAAADILLTRSTLVVDKTLLQDSQVKFVGTCTIGVDHLDTEYLDKQGITWTNAPGCNAYAVVQYVLSAMAALSPQWLKARIGIIGCGHIGGQVYRHLCRLGVECRVYDPFLDDAHCPDLVSLATVLHSDIVLCHAPLTTSGEYPTYHLLNEAALAQLRPGTLLVNAGRGAVVDNQALYRRLQCQKDLHVVLDVWEGEPDILPDLVPLVDIATPHIAGHSIEGKQRGSLMIYQALCRFLGIPPQSTQLAIAPAPLSCALSKNQASWEMLNQLLLSAYPIMEDDASLRRGLASNEPVAQVFDRLRRHYRVRHELSHFYYAQSSPSCELSDWLEVLGVC